MNDAEKVREALQAAYTPLADVDETVQTQVFDALDSLDSILTELAEHRDAAIELNTMLHEAKERVERAEARARTWMAEDLPAQVSDLSEMLTVAETRIQELEAALRDHAEFHRQPELTDTPPCCALVIAVPALDEA